MFKSIAKTLAVTAFAGPLVLIGAAEAWADPADDSWSQGSPVDDEDAQGGADWGAPAAAPAPRLPLPFVAPRGGSCGQMLAHSVGGTADNIVGMSTGPLLGFVGHNILGPLAGNIVGGALVHIC